MVLFSKTQNTPEISFNKDENKLEIKGRSFPENPNDFYKPILEDLLNQDFNKFTISIDLEYFNSSSAKYLFGLLRNISKKIENLCINWYYEEYDEDLLQFLRDISEQIPINIILKKNV